MMKKFVVTLLIIFSGLFFAGAGVAALLNASPNWEKQTLKVYIQKDSYSDMMHRAFQKWIDKCSGRLKIEFVASSPADIEVNFAKETDKTDGDIGSYSLTVKGGHITKAQITIAPNPEKNSNNLIYTVMLHEVGHALGLSDSTRKLGIMSTPVTENQDIINNDIYKLFRLNGWSYIDKNIQSSVSQDIISE